MVYKGAVPALEDPRSPTPRTTFYLDCRDSRLRHHDFTWSSCRYNPFRHRRIYRQWSLCRFPCSHNRVYTADSSRQSKKCSIVFRLFFRRQEIMAIAETANGEQMRVSVEDPSATAMQYSDTQSDVACIEVNNAAFEKSTDDYKRYKTINFNIIPKILAKEANAKLEAAKKKNGK